MHAPTTEDYQYRYVSLGVSKIYLQAQNAMKGKKYGGGGECNYRKVLTTVSLNDRSKYTSSTII